MSTTMPQFNLSELFLSFCTRAFRFMDAYRKGLNGKQAAYAGKKYHGHRVVPDSIYDELVDMDPY